MNLIRVYFLLVVVFFIDASEEKKLQGIFINRSSALIKKNSEQRKLFRCIFYNLLKQIKIIIQYWLITYIMLKIIFYPLSLEHNLKHNHKLPNVSHFSIFFYQAFFEKYIIDHYVLQIFVKKDDFQVLFSHYMIKK